MTNVICGNEVSRPFGTYVISNAFTPTLKRWAIVKSPFGRSAPGSNQWSDAPLEIPFAPVLTNQIL